MRNTTKDPEPKLPPAILIRKIRQIHCHRGPTPMNWGPTSIPKLALILPRRRSICRGLGVANVADGSYSGGLQILWMASARIRCLHERAFSRPRTWLRDGHRGDA